MGLLRKSFFVGFFFFLTACGTAERKLRAPAESLKNNDCVAALQSAEKLQADEPVLALLHKARALECEGNFKDAGLVYESVRSRMLDFTNPSVLESLWTSTLTNETASMYVGDAIESVYLRFMRGVGFLAQEKYREASNDFRGANEVLKILRDSYPTNPAYADNIGVRLLAAASHELLGENDIAYGLYVLAIKTACARYGAKAEFVNDINLALSELGKKLHRKHPSGVCVDAIEPPPKSSEPLVFVVGLVGMLPGRKEKIIQIPMPSILAYLATLGKTPIDPMGNAPLEIKVPVMDPVKTETEKFTIFKDKNANPRVLPIVDSPWEVTAEELERMSTTRGLRTGARAIGKFIALKAASGAASQSKNEGVQLVGLIGSLTSSLIVNASETADLRSWDSLPGYLIWGRIRHKGHLVAQWKGRQSNWDVERSRAVVVLDGR